MKKEGIDDERFIIANMSAAEGKRFAEFVTQMSGIARKSHKATHIKAKAAGK